MSEKIINNYKFILNEYGYIVSFYSVPDGEEYDYRGQMADHPEVLDSMSYGYYRFIDGSFVFDKERYNSIINAQAKEKEIANLKAELSSTDYQIIKCSEYQLQGLKAPYDIAALHTTRQALRDRINELESNI